MSYHSYPLEPHFYLVNLGFTGVYVFFLIRDSKHRMWVLVKNLCILHGQVFEMCEQDDYLSGKDLIDVLFMCVVKFYNDIYCPFFLT